tara:strand:+ start:3250 stop:3543 length:294 start_codon:yes stop_codon:yes gene_type:complete
MSNQLTVRKSGTTKMIQFQYDRTQRFSIEEPIDAEMPDYYIIMHDFTWFLNNEKEVTAWMDENLPRGRKHRHGMLIEVPTEADASKFLLKWQAKRTS